MTFCSRLGCWTRAECWAFLTEPTPSNFTVRSSHKKQSVRDERAKRFNKLEEAEEERALGQVRYADEAIAVLRAELGPRKRSLLWRNSPKNKSTDCGNAISIGAPYTEEVLHEVLRTFCCSDPPKLVRSSLLNLLAAFEEAYGAALCVF